MDGTTAYDFNEAGLAGRTLLVAGGSGGLGSAICTLLARDGADLVIGCRENRQRAELLAEDLSRRYRRKLTVVEGDIRDGEVRRRWVEAAQRQGGLYGLVCLVGDPSRIPFDQAETHDLTESFAVNCAGPVLLARDVAAAMRAAGVSGTVVLFSTMQALDLFPGSIGYAAPKSALVHAARILAKQWGDPPAIRVNVVAPGVNRAGMALASIAAGKYDRYVEQGVIPRFGRAEDVAKVVRLLVEPDNYLTGQVLLVDGGLTLRK